MLVTFLVTEDGDDSVEHVGTKLHYLHPAAVGLLNCVPCANDDMHRCIMAWVRPGLHSVHVIDNVQKRLGAHRARERRMLGHSRSHAQLPALLQPCLLDASVLYIGLVGGLLGGGYWFRAARPCECGHNQWSPTCTPPRWSRSGGVTRDVLDDVVSFCWNCLARRPMRLAELVTSWILPPGDEDEEDDQGFFLTQNEPQYWL